MKDRALIELTLRAFKGGHITLENAVTAIYNTYDRSKRLNWHSFYYGYFAGLIMAALFYVLLK